MRRASDSRRSSGDEKRHLIPDTQRHFVRQHRHYELNLESSNEFIISNLAGRAKQVNKKGIVVRIIG